MDQINSPLELEWPLASWSCLVPLIKHLVQREKGCADRSESDHIYEVLPKRDTTEFLCDASERLWCDAGRVRSWHADMVRPTFTMRWIIFPSLRSTIQCHYICQSLWIGRLDTVNSVSKATFRLKPDEKNVARGRSLSAGPSADPHPGPGWSSSSSAVTERKSETEPWRSVVFTGALFRL